MTQAEMPLLIVSHPLVFTGATDRPVFSRRGVTMVINETSLSFRGSGSWIFFYDPTPPSS